MYRVGALMSASHDSLRDDYEVTGIELDTLVASARAVDGCIGARMTGAGFGGCAIALCRRESVDRLQERVSEEYRRATGFAPGFHAVNFVRGAHQVASA